MQITAALRRMGRMQQTKTTAGQYPRQIMVMVVVMATPMPNNQIRMDPRILIRVVEIIMGRVPRGLEAWA